jgi:hypothetical protein
MPKFIELQSISGPAVTIATELIQDCRPTERYAPDKSIVTGTQIFLKGGGSVSVLGDVGEVTAKLNALSKTELAAIAMQGLCANSAVTAQFNVEEISERAWLQAEALVAMGAKNHEQ